MNRSEYTKGINKLYTGLLHICMNNLILSLDIQVLSSETVESTCILVYFCNSCLHPFLNFHYQLFSVTFGHTIYKSRNTRIIYVQSLYTANLYVIKQLSGCPDSHYINCASHHHPPLSQCYITSPVITCSRLAKIIVFWVE